jgi:hypothetical protein
MGVSLKGEAGGAARCLTFVLDSASVNLESFCAL